MSERSFKLGVVGLGDIARQAHLPALARSRDFRLVAVADPDPAAREQALRAVAEPGVGSFADATELFDSGVDAVILATPPWVTPRLAIEAVGRGIHVLAEKPFAVNRADASALADLDEPARRRYQLGLTYRFDPAIEHLRELIADRILGEGPIAVSAVVYDEANWPVDAEHDQRIRSTMGHGDPSVHEGAHVWDWLATIFGAEPEVESAWSLTTQPDLPTANIVGVRLRLGDAAVASVEYGWLVPILPPTGITFVGSRGLAQLDLVSFDLTVTTRGRHYLLRSDVAKLQRCFDRQLKSFAALVSGERTEPEVGIADGLRSLRIADAVASALASDATRG